MLATTSRNEYRKKDSFSQVSQLSYARSERGVESYRQIAEGMGISIGVISKYKKNIDNYGTIYTPQEDLAMKTGKKKQKPKEIDSHGVARLVIREALRLDPQCCKREICAMLQSKINFNIHPTTLGRWMKENNYSLQKICKIAFEVDPLERDIHSLVLQQVVRKKQLVTGDECSFDERSFNRYYGYGQRYVMYFNYSYTLTCCLFNYCCFLNIECEFEFEF